MKPATSTEIGGLELFAYSSVRKKQQPDTYHEEGLSCAELMIWPMLGGWQGSGSSGAAGSKGGEITKYCTRTNTSG